MAELSPSEQKLHEQGVHKYFLGLPQSGMLSVSFYLSEIALPQLDSLIRESKDSVFDEKSRRSLQQAIVETDANVKMSWQQLCRYFEIAINGPERSINTATGNFEPTIQAVDAFSKSLRAFRNEYANL